MNRGLCDGIFTCDATKPAKPPLVVVEYCNSWVGPFVEVAGVDDIVGAARGDLRRLQRRQDLPGAAGVDPRGRVLERGLVILVRDVIAPRGFLHTSRLQ